MKWRTGRRSGNIEDRRGAIGGFKIGGCGLLLLILIAFLTGTNPLTILTQIQEPETTTVQRPGGPQTGGTEGYDEEKDFVSAILADTEDTWGELMPQMQARYEPPTLVLFSNMVQSACGMSSSAAGPFYCPLDGKVYLDLDFFRELHERFGASGDFAQAYVIAHEVGHHVQNLLGISDRVRELQQRSSQTDANELSVRLELQADCFAGVWGHHAERQRDLLESGDVEEGMNAAAAIGDDRIQRNAGRSVSPETWTHGSSEMRVRWFRRGLETGDPNSCDTFGQ